MQKLFILTLALIVVAGCSSSTKDSKNEVRLGSLTQIWSKHQAVNSGALPQNEEEFKAFAEERGKFAVRGDIDGVGDLFVSDVDGQPFVMLFGKEQFKYENQNVIAYEPTATDGKVWMAMEGGAPRQIDETELNDLKK